MPLLLSVPHAHSAEHSCQPWWQATQACGRRSMHGLTCILACVQRAWGGEGHGDRSCFLCMQAVAAIPFLLTGGTDSKHYQGLCAGQTLRFAPVAMNRSAGDLKRVHGIDERVAESAYLDAIRFYVRFLQLALAG